MLISLIIGTKLLMLLAKAPISVVVNYFKGKHGKI